MIQVKVTDSKVEKSVIGHSSEANFIIAEQIIDILRFPTVMLHVKSNLNDGISRFIKLIFDRQILFLFLDILYSFFPDLIDDPSKSTNGVKLLELIFGFILFGKEIFIESVGNESFIDHFRLINIKLNLI